MKATGLYSLFNTALVCLCSCLLPTLAHAESPQIQTEQKTALTPKNFTAIYKARFSGIPVTAVRELKTLPDGSQYFSFEADSWVADLSETSQFNWSEDAHILPSHYTYERSGLGRDREAEVEFDWEAQEVTNNVERKPWTMELPTGVLDKLNYQMQLRADLLNKRELGEYQIADGGRIKLYRFEVLGEERLKTPIGYFDTIQIKRVRTTKEERQTIFWLAKDWDYLMVRIEQKEGSGGSYKIDIREATLDGVEVIGDK